MMTKRITLRIDQDGTMFPYMEGEPIDGVVRVDMSTERKTGNRIVLTFDSSFVEIVKIALVIVMLPLLLAACADSQRFGPPDWSPAAYKKLSDVVGCKGPLGTLDARCNPDWERNTLFTKAR